MLRDGAQKAIAIDTNLLVLLIVGSEPTRNTSIGIVGSRPSIGPSTSTLSCLIDSKAPKVVCTAHILTEASNLLRQIAEPMRSQIMRTFKRFIDGADEEPIESKRATAAPRFPPPRIDRRRNLVARPGKSPTADRRSRSARRFEFGPRIRRGEPHPHLHGEMS